MVEVVGWAGGVQATGRVYVGLNLAGAAGLAANGAAHAAWPSMTLNLLWPVIAMHALQAARRRTSRPT